MMSKKVVVALGGNAILTDDPTAQGQMKALRQTSKHLVELIKQGFQLIISHGNGPQVGNLLLQQAASDSTANPALPLDTCVAMTQGSIGYWLQKTLREALVEAGLEQDVVSVVTQVVVNHDDPAFENPTKPIGPFLTEKEAQRKAATSTERYIEDAGRGYRKVVPSPKPISIVEHQVIKKLVSQDVITISSGGGGIPVVQKEQRLQGVEAVIDKDFASAKLAELVEADYLLILTGVDHVFINYNLPNEEKLEEVTISQLKQWIKEEQFAPGSMLPKVEATIEFVEKSPDSKAVITSLENIAAFFDGGSATVIQYD
ncbi:carbamate kinase [Vagococcus lutrae]|uniref:carbamate kinase n=1 Tax=Vagococcus lutrae TaxID=81947 RepID=UPI00200FD33B|nr:carbamate kinase [Vagococcus lutrae]MCO7150213.1 carbamate kinase [Vagococcus lutrae]MDT2811913.1 carbamate kinase [Vagococcus lutrae]MDT2818318.1 carbamate kinase [Vagococcus lutrae]MDT2843115.1 carbamate kinase [Vagococcus lutrae]UQF72061.1 carbamate kinase [Vagococcus lutrae]